MKWRVKIGIILTFCFLLKASGDCCAQKFSKHEIKAAYVHNFIKFVQWPAEKTQLVLGIVGRNEFTSVLKAKLMNQSIGKYSLKIIHFSETNNVNSCDVLYMANDAEIDCKAILSGLKNKSILSIGESEEFFNYGGIINLQEREGGSFVFLINNSIALEEKIVISSKLLKLAFKIK